MKLTKKAPEVTPEERKQLLSANAELDMVLAAIDRDVKKVVALQKKQVELEKEVPALQRAAARFDHESELKLLANQRQLARVHDAIASAEGAAFDLRSPLWEALNKAGELVSRICQRSYEELLDQIAETLAPFYDSLANARWAARDFPAVRDLVHRLLQHGAYAGENLDRLSAAATDTRRKIGALLNGTEIWSFPGATAIASEPAVAA